MFSPRWSTFGLLCLVVMATVFGGLCGKFFCRPPVTDETKGQSSRSQTEVVSAMPPVSPIGKDPSAGNIAGHVDLFSQLPASAREAGWLAAIDELAGQDTGFAVQCIRKLAAENPVAAREYGDVLIHALVRNGHYSAAAGFALDGSDPLLRDAWLAAAYGDWANAQPESAAASALEITETDARGAALDAVISAWGQTNPKRLAEFAVDNLPDGSQRTRALTQALVIWASRDLIAAADWMNQFNHPTELDAGAAAVATQPDVMKQPLIAISWAQTISDPNLRSRTVAAIVESWRISDPSGADEFLRSPNDLMPEDRARFTQN